VAWLSGWGKRIGLKVKRASGAITDYQMKLLIGETAGAAGEQVHLSGLIQSAFQDLRFTTSDGVTSIPHWLESISGVSPNQLATVWIKFDSIGTGDTTFYMYYDNAGAGDISDGESTFLFFDDFSGDLSKWSGNTAYASIAGGICNFTNPGGGESKIYSAAQSGDIAWRSRANINAVNYGCLGFAHPSISQFIFVNCHIGFPNNSNFQRTAGSISNDNLGLGSYHIYDICRMLTGTDTIRGFNDGVQLGTDCITSVPTDDFPAMIRHYNAGTILTDWVLIRKWLATEPTWESFVHETEPTDWLAGWDYRKLFTVKCASGAVTNYQMKLLIGESSGAIGEQVDCEGNVLSSFNDLRFTKLDGTTLLDYWIESISGASPNQLATVWIEFDSIGTGDTTFYVYYGKVGASAVSNGANTFIVFDDFERGSDGDTVGGNWTEKAAHVHISTEQEYTGIASHTRSAKFIGATTIPEAELPVTASDNISIMFRAYKETAAGFTFGQSNTGGVKLLWIKWDTDETLMYINSLGAWSASISTITADTWHLFEFNNFVWASGYCDIYCDGTKLATVSGMVSDSVGIANKIHLREREASAGKDCWVDNVIVRNYRSTEPIWVSFGSEVPEPTTAPPTTLAPTTLAPTTLAPTTLAPTTLAPATLGSTTLAPTTLFGVSPRAILVNGKLVNKSILFGRLVQ
jgi:hypothetical protein